VAQGRSLVPEMSARRDGEQAASPAQRTQRIALAWWPRPKELFLRSIVQGDYQLIFNERRPGRPELYDLVADPMAQNNLVKENPALVRRMRARGLEAISENQPLVAPDEEGELILAPEVRARLKALGYTR